MMGSKCQDLKVAKLLGVNTERVESSVANWSRCLPDVTYCTHKQIHITYPLYLLTPSPYYTYSAPLKVVAATQACAH